MTTGVCLLGFTLPDSARDEIVAVDRHMPSQTHTSPGPWLTRLARPAFRGLLSVWPVSNFRQSPRRLSFYAL